MLVRLWSYLFEKLGLAKYLRVFILEIWGFLNFGCHFPREFDILNSFFIGPFIGWFMDIQKEFFNVIYSYLARIVDSMKFFLFCLQISLSYLSV